MRVFDEGDKVTHEVAIGSVDTLISCGLDESKVVYVIVVGDGRATRGTRNIFIGVRLKNALYRPRYISYGVYRDCKTAIVRIYWDI